MDALCFFLIQRYLRLSVSCIALLLFIAYEQQTAEDKAYYRSRQHDNVIHRTVFDDHYSGEDHAQRAACGERTKAAIQSSFRQYSVELRDPLADQFHYSYQNENGRYDRTIGEYVRLVDQRDDHRHDIYDPADVAGDIICDPTCVGDLCFIHLYRLSLSSSSPASQ